jgi:hypothetical protein
MHPDIDVYIGRDAVQRLLAYCKSRPSTRFTLVSDTNTYRALGERIETALAGAGLPITNVILEGDEVVADRKISHAVVDTSTARRSGFRRHRQWDDHQHYSLHRVPNTQSLYLCADCRLCGRFFVGCGAFGCGRSKGNL